MSMGILSVCRSGRLGTMSEVPGNVYRIGDRGGYRAALQRDGFRIQSPLLRTIEEAHAWLQQHKGDRSLWREVRRRRPSSWIDLTSELMKAWCDGSISATTIGATDLLDRFDEHLRLRLERRC
jgi:hypothetical protein